MKVEELQKLGFCEMEMMQLINKSIANESEDYTFVFHQKKKNNPVNFSEIIKHEVEP